MININDIQCFTTPISITTSSTQCELCSAVQFAATISITFLPYAALLNISIRTKCVVRPRSEWALTNRNKRRHYMPLTATDPIKVIFAILLPPLGVFLEVGLKGHFWLNILLTMLGFIPGIIHALYVILKH